MVECQNIEWKESWNDDLLKWICGFANAQGGKLYIGISDNGSVCGVPKIKKVLEDIPNKVRDVLGIKEIFSCILANQEVSRKSIAKQLGVSTKTIYRHLSEMREYVVCEGQGEDAIFRIVPANVPANIPHSVLQNVPANIPHSAAIKLDGIKGEIYRCILANPNVSRMSIAKQLGVSVKTIGRHLSEMKKYVIYDGRGNRSSWKII